MPNEELKERPQEDSFAKYAKQRHLLANLDKRLDYHNLQKQKHPYLNDLRNFMKHRKPSGSTDKDRMNFLDSTTRFETSAMAAQKCVTSKQTPQLSTLNSPKIAKEISLTPAGELAEGNTRSHTILQSERFRTTVQYPPYPSIRSSLIG